MKRIEAIIPNEKISAVSEAFKKAGIGGCTILEAKGRGRVRSPSLKVEEGQVGLYLNFQSVPMSLQ